jgi:hypothetical protein
MYSSIPELKTAICLLKEASILWKLYDNDTTHVDSHLLLANSKAIEAGHLIHKWNPDINVMRDIVHEVTPKEDHCLINRAWNSIGDWVY